MTTFSTSFTYGPVNRLDLGDGDETSFKVSASGSVTLNVTISNGTITGKGSASDLVTGTAVGETDGDSDDFTDSGSSEISVNGTNNTVNLFWTLGSGALQFTGTLNAAQTAFVGTATIFGDEVTLDLPMTLSSSTVPQPAITPVPAPAQWTSSATATGLTFVSPQFNYNPATGAWSLVSTPAPGTYPASSNVWFQGSTQDSYMSQVAQTLAFGAILSRDAGAPKIVEDVYSSASTATTIFNDEVSYIGSLFKALEPARLVNALVFGTDAAQIDADLTNANNTFQKNLNTDATVAIADAASRGTFVQYIVNFWNQGRLVLNHSTEFFTFQSGSDPFVGDSHTHVVIGGAAGQTYFAGPNGDVIFAGLGNDKMVGGVGNDMLSGGGGNDLLIGGADTVTPILGNLPGQTGQMGPEWHVASAQDFTGDGKADIMWVRNTTGDATLWTMNNGTLAGFSATQGHMGPEWTAAGSGDFNRDGKADLVWTHTGDVVLWLMNGPNLAGFAAPAGHMGPEWKLQGIGDFNTDGFSDLVWHSSNADVAIWSMSGTSLGGYGVSNGHIGAEWNVRAVADFNGDGRDEILWVSDTGDIQTWSMFGSNVTGTTNTGHMGPSWSVAGTGDFNMDGKMDLVWVDSLTNNVQIWRMNGGSIAQIITPSGHMGPEWKLQGVNDFTGDGRPDLLWVTADGKTAVWNMVGTGDMMAGGAGSDTFQFNALNETGKVITDFQAGAGGDILDLHNLEVATGYTGNDGLRDGSVRLIQNGVNTEVQVDSHFGEHHFVDAVTLQNVNTAALIHANFLV